MHYDSIDLSEGNDVVSSNNSKECIICDYWFFNHGFKFRDSVCNGCHDLTMLCLSINDITIVTVKDVDYRFIIYDISKSKAVSLLKSSVLVDRDYI